MMTLYGATGSGAAAIEAALRLLDVECNRVEAASWQPGPGLEQLKRVNPLAQVPTLVLDDGAVLTESSAILIELGLRFPDSGLLPSLRSARAQAIRGLTFIAANWYAAIGVIDYPERYCDPHDDAIAQAVRAGTRRRLHAMWDVFADTFPAAPYLSGTRVGALDLLAAVVSKWSGTRAHLRASRPRFYALLLAVECEPRVADIFERHWPTLETTPAHSAMVTTAAETS